MTGTVVAGWDDAHLAGAVRLEVRRANLLARHDDDIAQEALVLLWRRSEAGAEVNRTTIRWAVIDAMRTVYGRSLTRRRTLNPIVMSPTTGYDLGVLVAPPDPSIDDGHVGLIRSLWLSSTREHDIVAAVAAGVPGHEIGARCGITESRVSQILAKIGARNVNSTRLADTLGWRPRPTRAAVVRAATPRPAPSTAVP